MKNFKLIKYISDLVKKGGKYQNLVTLKFKDQDIEKLYVEQINKSLLILEGIYICGGLFSIVIIYINNY